MVLFVERGIRGGISQCNNRYSRANNPYVTDYNSTEDTTYIMYYVVNNLYRWAMMQHLPYGGFEWVENFEQDFSWNVADDSEIGYIIEVDLDYPEHIHDSHKDLPFCSEKMSPPRFQREQTLNDRFAKDPLQHPLSESETGFESWTHTSENPSNSWIQTIGLGQDVHRSQ